MQAIRPIEESERSLFLNTPVISTERLILRPPHKEDAEDMAFLANNIKVARMLGTMPHPYKKSDAEAFIQKTAQSAGQACVYAITETDTGRMVGVCGLHEDDNKYTQPFLGYWIGEPYWGKGYATEASKAMVDLFFKVTPLPELLVSARADNEASKNVIRKIGGEYTDKKRVLNQILNEEHDLENYHITRESWMGKLSV